MDCPKCGKRMYEICTDSQPDPLAHICNNTLCESVQERQSKVVFGPGHVMYYSEKLGRIRHFTLDGDIWIEQEAPTN